MEAAKEKKKVRVKMRQSNILVQITYWPLERNTFYALPSDFVKMLFE